MSAAWHCDGPDCNTWQTKGPRMGFIAVREVTPDGGESKRHFCQWDCVLRFAATIEPTVTVTMDDLE